MRIFFLLMAFLVPMGSHAQSTMQKNWYDELIFKDQTFVFEFIRPLSYSVSEGADIGECIATARKIVDSDIYSWRDEWLATADRIQQLAVQFKGMGNSISAKETYFRASNYYRSAGFFLDAKKDRKESISIWQKSVECFVKAIAFDPSISVISIPYEKATLPGYLIRSPFEKAPLLIIHSGFDGTKEEIYFEAGLAASKRGYNVLLFEGPGQGEVIKKQNLPFRYDWEKVVTPVVDYAMQLDFIDKKKIALLGISMGGYLAARAAAFEKRLAACIVNGGIFDLSAIFNNIPPEVLKLAQTNPQKFNQSIEEVMAEGVGTAWFFENAMWTMHADTPADVISIFSRYTLKEVIQNINCPMLVIDSEGDMFFPGQPQLVYDQLKSPKTLLKFSAETTAQAHCQMGAIAISNESILSWLDKTLLWKKP